MKQHNSQLRQFTLFVAIATGVLLAASASSPVYAQAQNTRFYANGPYGSGNGCIQNTCGLIEVSRTQTPQGVGTFLYFGYSQYNPITGVSVFVTGFGSIPNQDLVGDTPGLAIKNLSLNTNVANIPGFYLSAQTCDSGGCTPITLPQGVVTASFTKTDRFSVRTQGTYDGRYNLPDGSSLMIHSAGLNTSSSAQVAVNFFGTALDFGYGNLGEQRGVTVTIERTAP